MENCKMKTTVRIQGVKKTNISKLKTNILATTEILCFRFIIIVVVIIITICLSKQRGQFYYSLSSEFQDIFLFFFFFFLKLGWGRRAKRMWFVRQAKPQELF